MKRYLCRLLTAILLAGTGSVQAKAPDQWTNLLPHGDFSRTSVKEAWRPIDKKQKWNIERFEVITEGDRSFLRVKETPAVIWTRAAVPEGLDEIALTGDVRVSGLEPGEKPWDTAQYAVAFFDRFGNEIGNGWKAGERFTANTDGWRPIARRIRVPEGARLARIELAFKAKQGTYEIADLKLFDPTNPPEGVDTSKLGEAVEVAQTPKEPQSSGFGAIDTSRSLGASIDESQFDVTLHVSPDAQTDGDGSEARPLNSLYTAIDLARQQLNAGRSVRVALQPGVYRLLKQTKGLEKDHAVAALHLTDWTDAGREAVLVIEGVGGEAVLSGAEQWPADRWELVDAQKRIYRAEWTPNWGFNARGYYMPGDVRLHRRELVAINGRQLEPAILEDTQFTDPKGRVYDSVGNIIKEVKGAKNATYAYVGWRGPGILEPGQFGVAERDDHAGGNSIYFRLPDEVKNLDDATVEVGMIQTLMLINGKNNLVLRNLVFQHAASWYTDYFGNAALETGDWLSPKDTHDWLLENVTIRENGGEGMDTANIAFLTARNLLVTRNGAMGGAVYHLRHFQFQDTHFSDNNIRGGLSDYTTHHAAGMDFSGENGTFTNCSFNGNLGGFGHRHDVFGQHITYEGCQFNGNKEGVMYEISWGPILFRNCQFNGNRERGLFVLNVHDITIEHSQFIDNGVALSFYHSPSRETPVELMAAFAGHGGVPIQMIEDFTLRNSVIVGSTADQKLVERTPKVGSLDLYHEALAREYLGENNTFWNPASRQMFDLGKAWSGPEWADFETWVQATGEQPSSQWRQPQ